MGSSTCSALTHPSTHSAAGAVLACYPGVSFEADDLKVPKTGPLVWAAISAGIAYLCNK